MLLSSDVFLFIREIFGRRLILYLMVYYAIRKYCNGLLTNLN